MRLPMRHPSPQWEVFVQLSHGACWGEALSPHIPLGSLWAGCVGETSGVKGKKKHI